MGEDAGEDQLAGHEPGAAIERERPLGLAPSWAAARVLDVDARGSTVVLLLRRRPPLVVSRDGGLTWQEHGAGLPPGRAVALAENPGNVLFAARNRLYVSTDGGVFWRALSVELPEIRDVAWG
ncbi:MAG TPA: sialidase family protein [Gaiellaceae bacterium]|nr:sialidase family protein [Gaiellaceae bacterium]